MKKIFVTATGTDTGKTFVTAAMAYRYTYTGVGVCVLKPIITGFNENESDTHTLLRAMNRAPTLENIAAISPWRYAAPLSPHIAAADPIDMEKLTAFCRPSPSPEALVVEGAGGVMTPITSTHTMLDLMAALRYDVVLVTGTYLGSLSHTYTALRCLQKEGLNVKAIVVSESEAGGAPLAAIGESIRAYTSLRTIFLPRLAGKDAWKRATPLEELCK